MLRMRSLGDVDYVNAREAAFQVDRGASVIELYARLQGQLTVAAISNLATGVEYTQAGDEWALLKRLEISYNRKFSRMSVPGHILWWLHVYDYGNYPQVSREIGDGTTANPTFDSTLIIPMQTPGIDVETGLNTRKLSSFEIRTRWGSHLDINPLATGFTIPPKLSLSVLESDGHEGDYWYRVTSEVIIPVTQTQSRMRVEFPQGPVYAGFIMITSEDGVYKPGIVNGIRWMDGPCYFVDSNFKELSQIGAQKLTTGFIPRNWSPGESTQGAEVGEIVRRNVFEQTGGILLYDHAQGRIGNAVDASMLAGLHLDLDVTKLDGVCQIAVYPIEYHRPGWCMF